jgi:histone acetyltransferase (RNA polymerase elongator complex component)
MKSRVTIPFFIPHLGCPHECIFCRQDKISGAAASADPGSIAGTIRDYLKTIPADSHTEVAFFGGSFTGIDIGRQVSYLERVRPFLEDGSIKGIRLSTRPDYINDEILKMLKKHGVKTIELGVQSISDRVLSAAKRGHTSRDIKRASGLIKERGFALVHQIMVGLPESTLVDELKTAGNAASLGAAEARIYPVIVIEGTGLASAWRSGLYKPLSENEAVSRSAELILLLEKKGVRVIRCGLHPSEGLLSGRDILAGPFHEAFRQKVDTYIFGSQVERILNNRSKAASISGIYYNPSDQPGAVGYKRANALRLERALHRKGILIPSGSVKRGSLLVKRESP